MESSFALAEKGARTSGQVRGRGEERGWSRGDDGDDDGIICDVAVACDPATVDAPLAAKTAPFIFGSVEIVVESRF